MLLTVQLFPSSRHIIPLRSKYSSQIPGLKHPQYGVNNDSIQVFILICCVNSQMTNNNNNNNSPEGWDFTLARDR
jgi:hypothetical protein